MKKITFFVGLLLMLAGLPDGVELSYGNTGPADKTFYANSPQGGTSGTAIRKFVDSLPGVGAANANNLGQYIPLAVPDTTLYPGCDYYQIGIVEYTEKVHSDLPKATKFRGYRDLGGGQPAHYLGPLIVAQRDRPVRVMYTNLLPTGAAGNLFLPVDGTIMGAGMGPDGMNSYSQNRTSIHLHGLFGPWISDGTPHQWFTPAGETSSPWLQGVSFKNVPDMPDPGAGSNTMYYPNQQSNRLQFFHDHAYGITRLNVYAGMAAGYLVHDPVEDDLIDGTNNTGVNPSLAKIIPNNGGGVYNWGIPLIIQDKTFVPQDIATQDSKWDTAKWGQYGDLWFPHVYEPNQSITDPAGVNIYGRWDWGPWTQPNLFVPPLPDKVTKKNSMKAAAAAEYQPLQGPVKLPKRTNKRAAPVAGYQPLPGTTTDNPLGYNTSAAPEAFMDSMMVNGTLYPFFNVQPTAYRFRILNACNDRFLNLQLYLDASGGGSAAAATATVDTTPGSPTLGQVTAIKVDNGGTGFKTAPGIIFTGGGGFGAWATATVAGGTVTAITVVSGGSGYTSAPTVTVGATSEVKMVPAVSTLNFPAGWPTDGRDGGAPDPATSGPKIIQIGTEGGFLPGVVVLPNQPINYDYDRMSATFGNVLQKNLFLGPAERADIIIDFSAVAPGTNVILYNDSPAPVPGFQPRYDYYTGDVDQTMMGGATQTQVGAGPNTRTIMQFRVGAGTPAPFNLTALQTALPAAYTASQPAPIVPQTYYPPPYQAATDSYGHINDTTFTFTPVGGTAPVTQPLQFKAITEVFDKYGRMSAFLGQEYLDTTVTPFITNGIGFAFINPPSDVFKPGEVQIWKLMHNGVDTHAIHFHLVNVQLINRIGWDGVVKPPDPNERGWKETIRMNPLEAVYFTMKADLPKLPFAVPPSIRPLSPSMPLGATEGFTNVDPKTGQPVPGGPYSNVVADFGNEYMWHCHLLGHEENDMMRPLVVAVSANPSIYLSTIALTPSCDQGQNAVSQSFDVWNVGSGTLNYSITKTAAWLNVTPTGGSSTGSPVTHQVTYSTAGLAPGTYTDTISVSDPAADNTPQTILVTLTVRPIQPAISLSTNSLAPTGYQSLNAASQSFDVWNSSGGTLNYSITNTAAWLTVNPASGSSTGAHNTHQVTYSTAGLRVGTYTDTITISAPGATNTPQTISVTLTVAKKPGRPVARFTAVPTTGVYPLLVQFNDASTGIITGRTWSFGDGVGTSNIINPTYTYYNPGNYRATLTVTGPGGTSTRTVTIRVTLPAAPKVNFTATPTTGPAPLTVNFTNTTTGQMISGQTWDFGDGVGSSTALNPSYTYNNRGTYRVKLTVTNPGGARSKTVTIRVR